MEVQGVVHEGRSRCKIRVFLVKGDNKEGKSENNSGSRSRLFRVLPANHILPAEDAISQ